jgi:hypothetical protein
MWLMDLSVKHAQSFILHYDQTVPDGGLPPSAYLFRKVNQRPDGFCHLPQVIANKGP